MAIVVAMPAVGDAMKAAARVRPSQKLCNASAVRLMYAATGECREDDKKAGLDGRSEDVRASDRVVCEIEADESANVVDEEAASERFRAGSTSFVSSLESAFTASLEGESATSSHGFGNEANDDCNRECVWDPWAQATRRKTASSNAKRATDNRSARDEGGGDAANICGNRWCTRSDKSAPAANGIKIVVRTEANGIRSTDTRDTEEVRRDAVRAAFSRDNACNGCKAACNTSDSFCARGTRGLFGVCECVCVCVCR